MASNSSPSYALRVKSIFGSKTFWGAIFTAIAAVAPIVGEAFDNGRLSGKHAAQIVVILAGAAVTVVGRVQANVPVYTPHSLPGPNREDLDPPNHALSTQDLVTSLGNVHEVESNSR